MYKFDYLITKKKIYLILLLAIIIFVSRNISRIDKEFEQYGYNPFNKAFFYLNKDGFILNDLVKVEYKNKRKNTRFLVINK